MTFTGEGDIRDRERCQVIHKLARAILRGIAKDSTQSCIEQHSVIWESPVGNPTTSSSVTGGSGALTTDISLCRRRLRPSEGSNPSHSSIHAGLLTRDAIAYPSVCTPPATRRPLFGWLILQGSVWLESCCRLFLFPGLASCGVVPRECAVRAQPRERIIFVHRFTREVACLSIRFPSWRCTTSPSASVASAREGPNGCPVTYLCFLCVFLNHRIYAFSEPGNPHICGCPRITTRLRDCSRP